MLKCDKLLQYCEEELNRQQEFRIYAMKMISENSREISILYENEKIVRGKRLMKITKFLQRLENGNCSGYDNVPAIPDLHLLPEKWRKLYHPILEPIISLRKWEEYRNEVCVEGGLTKKRPSKIQSELEKLKKKNSELEMKIVCLNKSISSKCCLCDEMMEEELKTLNGKEGNVQMMNELQETRLKLENLDPDPVRNLKLLYKKQISRVLEYLISYRHHGPDTFTRDENFLREIITVLFITNYDPEKTARILLKKRRLEIIKDNKNLEIELKDDIRAGDSVVFHKKINGNSSTTKFEMISRNSKIKYVLDTKNYEEVIRINPRAEWVFGSVKKIFVNESKRDEFMTCRVVLDSIEWIGEKPLKFRIIGTRILCV